MSDFNAIVLEEADGKVTPGIQTLTEDQLPEGDVTVTVKYSTLNYKDGMVMNGLGRLVRDYPHIPGIDFCGVVESSESPDYKAGDEVILTGWRVGEVYWGGYAQKARVRSGWLVPKPDGLTLKQTMALGTAGLTALLAIMTLEEHGLSTSMDGEVLVTGGSGGVGSVATAVLASNGYEVAASTGSADSHDYLRDLGAAAIVERAELETAPRGPLGAERWIGAIDNVGGATLHTVLANMKYWSCVASVGLAASPELKTTVLPFLLRGVNLCGVDSAMCSKERRIAAWNRLAGELPLDKLDAMTNEIGLAGVAGLANDILKGRVRGRTVIDVNK